MTTQAPPRVSVLVPAHNDGDFLDANLSSLAAQTFTNFEAIVADDASHDATPEIAAVWAGRDPRFRLSRLEQNVGMNRNWNRALAEARGDLVIKLDADDAMTPRCLELLVAELDRSPNVRFAACRTLDCDLALAPQQPFLGDEGLRRHGLDPLLRHQLPGRIWLPFCFDDIQLWHSDAQLYRRTDLIALGGWDERWIASDTDLILRALATTRPVVHVPELGILYRRRPGSSSDREHKSGIARLELAMIGVRFLAAEASSLRPLGRGLRQNWWRLWRNFKHESVNSEVLSNLSSERRTSLTALARETSAMTPPLRVRAEGELRHLAWRLRRRPTKVER